MLLAGDVGGTKTLLGLFSRHERKPVLVNRTSFTTVEHASLSEMIALFIQREAAPPVEAACFGVAGPVSAGRAQLTNVSWAVDAPEIARRFSFRSVTLLNDLEAMAYAVPVLDEPELVTLQHGRPAPGNAALIAAGTGLGEALLHRVDDRLVPSPSEGGHADYSPRTPREVSFMEMLTSLHGRAEWEQVLSGPGLVNLHRFTHTRGCAALGPSSDESLMPALISRAALEGRCPQCAEALEMFVAAYGAESGNLALRSVAAGGLYIGGGIAPKILPAMKSPRFLDAFLSKPPMTEFLERVPVRVIVNDESALLGAAVYANGLAQDRAR